MNILGTFSLVLVLSVTISVTNADKNPTGLPLGEGDYYPKYIHSYYKKPASYYRSKCVPGEINNDIVTELPDRNGGRPYHNCRYTISSLTGLFFRDNGTFFPCKSYDQDILDIQKVREPLHKILQVINGVQEAVATKFRLPIPEATDGRPSSIPVTGGIFTEAFIMLKNTSVPHIWHRDEQFHLAIQKKVKLLKETAVQYRDTQLQLLMKLHEGLANSVDDVEQITQNLNQNRNQNDRREASPYIVTDFQSFATPTTRQSEDILNEDYIQAEKIFGLSGARFEFQDSDKVADRMIKLAETDGGNIDARNLGNSPQEASRNIVNMHQGFLDLVRRGQIDLEQQLHDKASKIMANSQFTFKVAPSLQVPFCPEDILVDPEGSTVSGNASGSQGKGRV